jgi:hypothetical protein
MTNNKQRWWEDRFKELAQRLNLREETVSGVDEQALVLNLILEIESQTERRYAERVRGEINKLLQDERPTDVFTGEPVETYGYEATHNQALKQVLALKSLNPESITRDNEEKK